MTEEKLTQKEKTELLEDIETYKHHATGEIKELKIIEIFPKYKIGYDKKTDRYFKIIKDKNFRWQINKTSFFKK